MVMQRIDFPSSRGFCKTDRGLVEADYNMSTFSKYGI